MVASVGINYGQIASNLRAPENVVPLVRQIGATKVKLYDADPKVLKAFANNSVEFIVRVLNEDIARAKDPVNALALVKTNVQRCTTMSGNLLPAMEGIHTVLASLGIDRQVSVTTTHSLSTLEVSYLPSAGEFRWDLVKYIALILDFHSKTGSTFQPNQGVVDPGSNLSRSNLSVVGSLMSVEVHYYHASLLKRGNRKCGDRYNIYYHA